MTDFLLLTIVEVAILSKRHRRLWAY